jgi:2-keto-4-pentenoate hydratase/2-oxohepta-3-ene-1,7-dioic acid hydratase in catechol pathway
MSLMTYQHHDVNGHAIALPVGKVVCVGRNYLQHIQELNNSVPEQPLLFIKPSTSAVNVEEVINLPTGQGECHNEIELAVLIQQPLKNAKLAELTQAIWGYGLALDLTLRQLQDSLKRQGYPWERAKAFDGSCPLSAFVRKSDVEDHQALSFQLAVNSELRQQGYTKDMLTTIDELIVHISQTFTLLPGDIVLTGTPRGVAALQHEDQLTLSLHNGQNTLFTIHTKVN